MIDKFESWFQVAASVVAVLFCLIMFVRTSSILMALCFAAMLVLSWKLFMVSLKELIKKGGRR